ncbi:MAG: GH3 auxin-responsive promoter family protein [Saprospiraceae bacterium]|nr:GH3 auxin-responsive promoter family protein [Saprospiraceae bacterium]
MPSIVKSVINYGAVQLLKWRYKRIEQIRKYPHDLQRDTLQHLLETASGTEFGKKHGFSSIKSLKQYQLNVPAGDYEDFKPYIHRMMMGEKDILWNGRVKNYSKSSGTTSDKSKFIPVPRENMVGCHFRGSWDTMTILYHINPEMAIFANRNLIMGGTTTLFEPHSATRFGDISALMIHQMPNFVRSFYTPSLETALLADWEEKIERTAIESLANPNIAMFGGVPTWNIVLFKKLLEMTGAENMLQIWPKLKAYVHGGVGFEPYRSQFEALLPADDFIYLEVYNASEGFFAVSDESKSDDMLLLLSNGIYYEFVAMEDFINDKMDAIPLEDVKPGVQYAIIITTNSGLWRYMPGDTITFTSVSPYRIKVTGRTKQFVNAFGEELMIANTDKALAETCKEFGAVASEYTVAPIYLNMNGKGGHQWIVEFEKDPHDLPQFAEKLDINLQKVNSDYEAKRSKNLALDSLKMMKVPKGRFYKWLASKGKLGGQNKVPRLSNHRHTIDEIVNFLEKTN